MRWIAEPHKAKAGHGGRLCCVDELTVYFGLCRLAAAPSAARLASVRRWVSGSACLATDMIDLGVPEFGQQRLGSRLGGGRVLASDQKAIDHDMGLPVSRTGKLAAKFLEHVFH